MFAPVPTADFQYAIAALDLEFLQQLFAVIRSASDPVVQALPKVVGGRNVVVPCLVFEIWSLHRTHKQGDIVANGIDATGRSIAQIVPRHLQRITSIRVAEQRQNVSFHILWPSDNERPVARIR